VCFGSFGSCVLAEEQKEVTRSDVTALRLAVGQETFEKDTLQQSCSDLRTQVKRLEAEKAEFSRIIQETKQRISGTLTHARTLTRTHMHTHSHAHTHAHAHTHTRVSVDLL